MIDTPAPGTPLPTENKIAAGIDTAVSVGTSIAEKTVETAAEASQTWLALPVVKQIFEGIVNWIMGIASKTGQLVLTFGVTLVQGNIENKTLVDAEKEYQSAIQYGDPNAIAKAEQDFQKAQSAAANSDGSAHPK